MDIGIRKGLMQTIGHHLKEMSSLKLERAVIFQFQETILEMVLSEWLSLGQLMELGTSRDLVIITGGTL